MAGVELWAGEVCEACSSHVNASFIFAKRIHHPTARPCIHVEPPASNEPSEEAWQRFADAQPRICQ